MIINQSDYEPLNPKKNELKTKREAWYLRYILQQPSSKQIALSIC